MNQNENMAGADYQSIFVSVGAFYPHHVGYEVHSLPVDMLTEPKGTARAVQGSHTLNLEGLVMKQGAVKEPKQACDITITDISTSEVNYSPEDNHAYMGSLRLSDSENITAVLHLKPSIVRDILHLFYNRARDEQFQLKRAVIVRIDIPVTSYGDDGKNRYKILRIAFE